MTPKKRPRAQPARVGDAVSGFLEKSGLRDRVAQSEIVVRWRALVGAKIAAVTEPLHVSADGMLFVAVRTNSWMSELSLLEPDLLRAINAGGDWKPVRKIRFRLMR